MECKKNVAFSPIDTVSSHSGGLTALPLFSNAPSVYTWTLVVRDEIVIRETRNFQNIRREFGGPSSLIFDFFADGFADHLVLVPFPSFPHPMRLIKWAR